MALQKLVAAVACGVPGAKGDEPERQVATLLQRVLVSISTLEKLARMMTILSEPVVWLLPVHLSNASAPSGYAVACAESLFPMRTRFAARGGLRTGAKAWRTPAPRVW